MAEVVLFHHAQGLTPGVAAFADELRHAGHIVHTPDLFEGRTFDSIEQGLSFVKELGFSEVMARGVRAVDALPAELVFAGFSLGVVPAQMLAQTRPGARGALFFYACIPVSEFGQTWPEGLPVQPHLPRRWLPWRGATAVSASGRYSVRYFQRNRRGASIFPRMPAGRLHCALPKRRRRVRRFLWRERAFSGCLGQLPRSHRLRFRCCSQCRGRGFSGEV